MEENKGSIQFAVGIVIVKIILTVLDFFELGLTAQLHIRFAHSIELIISFLIIKQLFDYLRKTHDLPLSNLIFGMIVLPLLYYLILGLMPPEMQTIDETLYYIMYTVPDGIQDVGFIIFSTKLMNNTAQEYAFRERISQVGLGYLIATVSGIILPYLLSTYWSSVMIIVGIVYLVPLLAICRLYYYQLKQYHDKTDTDEFSRYKERL